MRIVIVSEALHRMPACGRQGVQGEAKQSPEIATSLALLAMTTFCLARQDI